MEAQLLRDEIATLSAACAEEKRATAAVIAQQGRARIALRAAMEQERAVRSATSTLVADSSAATERLAQCEALDVEIMVLEDRVDRENQLLIEQIALSGFDRAGQSAASDGGGGGR
jgi:Flp pilus assembly protein CpaB|tara:strand:+ start:305 stop:652 length:348 start_codon:yes stop_codon:yes gene_type:complete